jgi:hypothetical protein
VWRLRPLMHLWFLHPTSAGRRRRPSNAFEALNGAG